MYGTSSQIASLSLLHISAILNADDKFSPFLFLIKLCVFTAIWMSSTHRVYGGWSQSGEIDIMESKGNDVYVDGSGRNLGNNLMGSTLHWGPDDAHDKWQMTHWEK
jgi:hypothetical protein